MTQRSVFESEIVLPDATLTTRAQTLLGFSSRYARVSDHMHLLLSRKELDNWNHKHHGGGLAVVNLVADQYPLVIFYGDVGTGKTATAECIANQLIIDSQVEDAQLFKLSNRVRGSGKVGEIGTLLTEAFQKIAEAAGKGRQAILIIDEGDSLASARTQEHSHHEDKVAVNTLIQEIDGLRRFSGRVLTILCTNRVDMLDPAIQRRAAIVEEFKRPTCEERYQLFAMDLDALSLAPAQLAQLASATGARNDLPNWTYSDIRTRLYPAALARAFPNEPLQFDHLLHVATTLKPSPVMENQ